LNGRPADEEGSQGRAKPARRGSLDGPVVVVDILGEEGRQAFLFAGCRSGCRSRVRL